MTTIRIVGVAAAAAPWVPRWTGNVALEVWSAGETATGGGGGGGRGASYAKVNSLAVTKGTALTFLISAPANSTVGDAWISNTGASPTGTTQGAMARGPGSASPVSIGDITFGNAAGGSGGANDYGAGGGASGPNGIGGAGGSPGGTIFPGGGGGGANLGSAGGAGSSSQGGLGGNPGSGAGVAGAGGTAGSIAGVAGTLGAGGGGGYGASGGSHGAGGNGGDDWDNGGGGGGAAGYNGSGVGAPSPGTGGTPGGGAGGGDANGAAGFGLIKITYPGSDPDQIIYGGAITQAQVLANIPASWNGTYTVDVMNGGFTVLTQGAPQFLPSVHDSPKLLIARPGLIRSNRPQPVFASPWQGDFTPQIIVPTFGGEPLASRSPFRLLPGRGPRPLVPNPWRGDFSPAASANAVIVQTQDDQTASITATIGAEPIAVRSPFRLLPGRGPRPLVPNPWRYYIPDIHAAIVQTQDDQTASVTATNLDTAAVVQTQDDQTSSITASVGAEPIASRSPFRLLPGRGPRPLVPQPWRYFVQNANAVITATQDDQTVTATASVGAEPIAARSPFRLLPGKGPRPLVPQPWRYYIPLANAAVTATQDDQTSSITATIGAEPIASRSPFRLLPGRGPRPLVPNPWRGDFTPSTDNAVVVQTQDDQTASITASVGAEPIAVRSPFRLLPGRGPRPLVPNPWRYVVPAATPNTGSIVQTQDDQTISATAVLGRIAVIDQNQDDHTISSTATLLAAAAIAQTQSNQTIVSAATNRDHAAIVQTQDDQTIVATALRLLPRTAAIVQTQQNQTIQMAGGQPRAVVAQPQFLW